MDMLSDLPKVTLTGSDGPGLEPRESGSQAPHFLAPVTQPQSKSGFSKAVYLLLLEKPKPSCSAVSHLMVQGCCSGSHHPVVRPAGRRKGEQRGPCVLLALKGEPQKVDVSPPFTSCWPETGHVTMSSGTGGWDAELTNRVTRQCF